MIQSVKDQNHISVIYAVLLLDKQVAYRTTLISFIKECNSISVHFCSLYATTVSLLKNKLILLIKKGNPICVSSAILYISRWLEKLCWWILYERISVHFVILLLKFQSPEITWFSSLRNKDKIQLCNSHFYATKTGDIIFICPESRRTYIAAVSKILFFYWAETFFLYVLDP